MEISGFLTHTPTITPWIHPNDRPALVIPRATCTGCGWSGNPHQLLGGLCEGCDPEGE